MSLTQRQKTIVEIVKENQPIIGDEIAKRLSLTRSALRTDFSILTGKGILNLNQRLGIYIKREREKIYS